MTWRLPVSEHVDEEEKYVGGVGSGGEGYDELEPGSGVDGYGGGDSIVKSSDGYFSWQTPECGR